MKYDFDPSGTLHPLTCCCPCCGGPLDEEDMAAGIEQAEEMLRNMLEYGTIDKPKELISG